jgi:hypothetical protein
MTLFLAKEDVEKQEKTSFSVNTIASHMLVPKTFVTLLAASSSHLFLYAFLAYLADTNALYLAANEPDDHIEQDEITLAYLSTCCLNDDAANKEH